LRLRHGRNAARSRPAARRSGPPRRRPTTTRRAIRRRAAAGLASLSAITGGALAFAERTLTPARGLALVALVAAISLGGSQFTDYRAVEVGAPEYESVEDVAPAPELDRRGPRSAHGAWVLAIAAASALVVALAVTRNWRLARLLIFLGAAAIAISLLVDAREGLREGTAGVAYQGAKAVLLGGFWVQLSAGVTLIVAGPLLAVELRDEREARRNRRAGRGSRRRDAARRIAAPGSGVEGAAT
jgi:hypothetical protein